MTALVFAVLTLVLVTATCADLRRQRIPNELTLGGIAVALALAAFSGGFMGFRDALLGASLGAAITLPLHLMGGLGAADVKLMGFVGACLGPVGAVMATLYALIAGVPLAMVVLAKAVQNRAKVAQRPAPRTHPSASPAPLEETKTGRRLNAMHRQTFPYAGAIAAGTAFELWRTGVWAAALGLAP